VAEHALRNLSSPSRSQEGGNEPSCRAASAELDTFGPIPPREAGGPLLAYSLDGQAHPGCGLSDGWTVGGPAEAARGRAQRAADGAAGLPCPNKNNSTEERLTAAINRLTSAHRKTAFALKENVTRMCATYGIERIGFLTLTFPDHVTCAREAGRRLNSLRSHVLRERYVESIAVLERMKSRRIHFHLLVVLPIDIRTGFDYKAVAQEDYRSANPFLRGEWEFWRETAEKYGFGRTELMPVKSDQEVLGKYVGKYIAKHIEQRESPDKGVRLVRYSTGARRVGCRFSFVSVGSWLWRAKLGAFADSHGVPDFERMRAIFGSSWAYHLREEILATPLQTYPSALHAFCDGAIGLEEARNMVGGILGGGALSVIRRHSICDSEIRAAVFAARVREAVRREKERSKDLDTEPVDVTCIWSDGHIERLATGV
jgi:hypothetical protein